MGTFVNGTAPYFRCYAADWIARLAGTSSHSKALVLEAVCLAWTETKSGKATRSLPQWQMVCGCSEAELRSAIDQLNGLPWLALSEANGNLSIHVPDMDDQASIVTHERDKKRKQREQGTVPKTVPGTKRPLARELARDRESERSGAVAPLTVVAGSTPMEDEYKHAVLKAALEGITKKGRA